MLDYKVKHHIPGRIRIETPLLKKLSIPELKKLFDMLSLLPVPLGIRSVKPNLLSGSLVIEYDPQLINVLEYIKEMASSKEILILMEGMGQDTGFCKSVAVGDRG